MELFARYFCGVSVLVFVFLSCRYYIHMLQLNSYRSERYTGWLKEHKEKRINFWALWALAALLFLFWSEAAAFIAAGVLLLGMAPWKKKTAKKPLVYTARVKRLMTASMILHALFVCVILLLPAAAAVILLVLLAAATAYAVYPALFAMAPVEKAIARHYYKEAQAILSSMKDLIVIGVTGSYGKTSTKYIVSRLLSEKYSVLMTPGSFNTTMGVVRTVREMLKPTHQVFVVEMGAKNIGDVKEICDLVNPRYGVISSIGPQHLETFGSIDNILRTKFELADAVKKNGGTMFLNVDNDYIRNYAFDGDKVTYGTDGRGDVSAKDTALSASGTTLSIDGETFQTKLLGRHSAVNIAGAYALAKHLGVPTEDIAVGIRRLTAPEHRLQLLKNPRYTIIDDAYNSNPSGANAAVETLALFSERKILVTPGMVELGEAQYELNRAFGEKAASAADYIVLVGEKQAPPIAEGALGAGFPKERLYEAKDIHDALAYVYTITDVPSVVLLENDLPDNFL